MKKRKITNPKTIFRVYCDEYRKIWPQVLIPQALARRIDDFIEDVTNYRTITPFSKAELSTFGPAPGSVKCSIYFIEHLKRMSIEMRRQKCFEVTPERACELLYNLDADQIYTPEIMRLEMVHGYYSLVSVPSLRDFDLCLCLDVPHEDIDWTLSD